MRILVTNDDGVSAPGLWALVEELHNNAEVFVVAPDREQSGVGTSITLHQPLRVKEAVSLVKGVETYSVEGTPADSVIVALSKLVKGKVDLVISGINQGPNLGDDVLISGTVGAALQGYLHGFTTLAISAGSRDSLYLDDAARLATLLAKRIDSNALPADIFLNVNLPDLPLAKIKGIEITRLANGSHTDTATEGDNGKCGYYWLVRQGSNKNSGDGTDIRAIEQGYISITPLNANNSAKPPASALEDLCASLIEELRQ